MFPTDWSPVMCRSIVRGKEFLGLGREEHSRLLTLSWQSDNKEQQACISEAQIRIIQVKMDPWKAPTPTSCSQGQL